MTFLIYPYHEPLSFLLTHCLRKPLIFYGIEFQATLPGSFNCAAVYSPGRACCGVIVGSASPNPMKYPRYSSQANSSAPSSTRIPAGVTSGPGLGCAAVFAESIRIS